MTKKPPEPPQFAPPGYELLSRAYDYYIEPTYQFPKERMRRTLADGRINVMLNTPSGKWHEVPQHVWNRKPVEEKIYPRFDDGWMQVELDDEAGSVVEGWIYVPLKILLKEIELPTIIYDPDAEQFMEPPFKTQHDEANVKGVANTGGTPSTTDHHATKPTLIWDWPEKPETQDQWRDLWARYLDLGEEVHKKGVKWCANKLAKEDLGATKVVDSRAETYRKKLGQMKKAGGPPPKKAGGPPPK